VQGTRQRGVLSVALIQKSSTMRMDIVAPQRGLGSPSTFTLEEHRATASSQKDDVENGQLRGLPQSRCLTEDYLSGQQLRSPSLRSQPLHQHQRFPRPTKAV
jgi:hypothetical protein